MLKGFYNDGKLYYRNPIYWTLKNPKIKGDFEYRGGEYIIYDVVNQSDGINGKCYNFKIIGTNLIQIIL